MRQNKTIPFVALLVVAASACASHETVVASPAQAEPIVVTGSHIQSGTRVPTRLDQAIGKDTPRGQTFTAKVMDPIVDENGEAIIPAQSVVMGRVGDVKAGSGSKPAEVDLVIQSVLVRGVEHPIDARIVATNVEGGKPGVKGSHVAIGAGGGGLLGGILGGWQGAVIGGVTGALAGTAISLGVSGKEAKLPAGTVLVVELQRPISVASLRGPRPAMR
jgi:hypothetical protein